MVNLPLTGSVISKRLSILAQLDASAGVSFMERSQLRLRVFGIVDSLDRGTITTTTAFELLEALERDVTILVAR